MALLQTLKCVINERLSAAAEELFGAIEMILTEYEEVETLRSRQHIENQQSPILDFRRHTTDLRPFNMVSPEHQEERSPRLLHGGHAVSPQIKEEKEEALFQRPEEADASMMGSLDGKTRDDTLSDFLRLPVCKEEASLEQQGRSPSLDQEEPEPPQIKNEQKELLQKPVEADVSTLTFSILNTLYDDGNGEPLASTSTDHMKTQSMVEDYGAPQPTGDVQVLSSNCSESDTDDSAVWVETREDQSALNTLKSHETHMEGQTLHWSNELSQDLKSSYQTTPTRNHSGKIHSGPYSCTVCGKLCGQMGDLKKHMRTHTGEKPFICAVCGKGFGQNAHLKTHMRIHTGERPFICTVCGKGFTQRISLEIHSRIHTGEKPFLCTVCGKSFSRLYELKKHTKTHERKTNFSCTVCGRCFVRETHLQKHMGVHTRRESY